MRLVSSLWPLLVGLALFLQTTSQQTPPRDSATPDKGTASISGRIVAGDTGLPQRDATVSLDCRELQLSRRTTTDAEGRYAFEELPAGRCALSVVPSRFRPGYLATRFSAADAARALVVELADGQKVERFDLSLDRAGVLSGRVVDELGEPMANIRVTAMVSRSGGESGASGSTTNATDDQGRFRVFALPPGDYLLRSEPPRSPVGGAGSDEADEGYLPTYYPATASAAEASVLPLGPGEELNALEIRLVRSRTFRITGTVFGLDGLPAGGVNVMLTDYQAQSVRNAIYTTRPDGAFEIANLAPGSYALAALTGFGAQRDANGVSAPVRVTIATTDVDNLTLALTPGVTLRGQIVTDAGAVPTGLPTGLRVNAVPEVYATAGGRSYGDVDEDWSFEVAHVRGPVVIRALGRLPEGYHVMAVFFRGIEISDDFTEFAEPTTPRELRVVVGNRGATLSGVVTDAAGRAVPAGRRFLVFPAEPEHRTPRSLRFRMFQTDENGHYTVGALPPGDYLVAADDGSFRYTPASDRAELEPFVPNAFHVTLQRDEQKTLNLRAPERR